LDLIKALVLGIVQGLSEFLPISSSGHLVLVEEILNFTKGGLAFEVFVHFGTLLAVLWIFRSDFIEMIKALPYLLKIRSKTLPPGKKDYALLDLYIIVGSLPAALIGIALEDTIEKIFENIILVLFMLFVTGIIMWSSRYPKEKREQMKTSDALLIGLAQAFAIIPGISRSGSTIVTGLWLGIQRNQVARFSFILSSPVIFGATLLKLKDLFQAPPPSNEIITYLAATIAAGLSGYFAIIWLLDIIKKKKLEWFGFYCIAVSVIGFIFVLLD
jgi:undecaprenyl-diphosphatase